MANLKCSAVRVNSTAVLQDRMELTSTVSPARWRHNSVMPQIDHHLSVMVEAMCDGQGCDPEAGHGVLSPGTFDRLSGVLFVHRSDGLVHVREGIFQKL